MFYQSVPSHQTNNKTINTVNSVTEKQHWSIHLACSLGKTALRDKLIFVHLPLFINK
ncbi:hypothetical protein SOHN41_00920 [Shewanella sp. HN-41]|nr:hypothetical protein SOHN41_00920 [Shewanella sp. HN-41]